MGLVLWSEKLEVWKHLAYGHARGLCRGEQTPPFTFAGAQGSARLSPGSGYGYGQAYTFQNALPFLFQQQDS